MNEESSAAIYPPFKKRVLSNKIDFQAKINIKLCTKEKKNASRSRCGSVSGPFGTDTLYF